MLEIPCPNCGARPAVEFAFVGDAEAVPEPAHDGIEAYRRRLYFHRNEAGWVGELWYHGAGCGRHLSVERHRSTNEVRPARPDGGTGAAGGLR